MDDINGALKCVNKRKNMDIFIKKFSKVKMMDQKKNYSNLIKTKRVLFCTLKSVEKNVEMRGYNHVVTLSHLLWSLGN